MYSRSGYEYNKLNLYIRINICFKERNANMPDKNILEKTIDNASDLKKGITQSIGKAGAKISDTVSTNLKDVPPEKKKEKKRWYKHVDVNNGEKSFAAGINIYKVLWVFIIGCVLGVLWETVYVYATTGVLERRSGMIFGPFNQIYGIGAVLFTVVLYRYRNRSGLFIFLFSMMIGLIFEYVCSWIQEKLFGSTSWDYSKMPFNLDGRINLVYGVGWGVMGLIFLTHFWPWMSEMIERIPNKIGKPLTIAFAIFLAIDLLLSGLAVFREKQRILGEPANNIVEKWLDDAFPNGYMAKKYPSMTFDNAQGQKVKPLPNGQLQVISSETSESTTEKSK